MIDAVFERMAIDVEPFSLCELAPRGWLEMPRSQTASLHYVIAGDGALHLAGHEPKPIRTGDLVLVPAADRHAIGASDGRFVSFATCQPVSLGLSHQRIGSLDEGLGLVVLCARIALRLTGAGRVIDLLRRPLVERSGKLERDRALMDLVLDELAEPRAGSLVQIKSLLLYLIIDALRSGVENEMPEADWLVALKDARLWPVLEAVLADPGAEHSVESLAEIAGMSRARFAAKFREAFGFGPMHMVRELRLQHAARLLIEGEIGVARTAERVGFSSRSHFTQQFEARYGISPARYGKLARGAPGA